MQADIISTSLGSIQPRYNCYTKTTTLGIHHMQISTAVYRQVLIHTGATQSLCKLAKDRTQHERNQIWVLELVSSTCQCVTVFQSLIPSSLHILAQFSSGLLF